MLSYLSEATGPSSRTKAAKLTRVGGSMAKRHHAKILVTRPRHWQHTQATHPSAKSRPSIDNGENAVTITDRKLGTAKQSSREIVESNEYVEEEVESTQTLCTGEAAKIKKPVKSHSRRRELEQRVVRGVRLRETACGICGLLCVLSVDRSSVRSVRCGPQ
ncbi:hypothetical protein T05_6855 [Trichinella murrelli]|uniref:Uncharacterized protein n=1 Tax=Trichinella murrelli TaxID=144512 RepID=A0A0V0T4M2_9BILA|nr:hypothetical protein T05_6855 [Trichinella murrelli]